VSLRPRRSLLMAAVVAVMAACVVAAPVFADTVPTGERHHGQVTVEPAYDDATGSIVYLATPDNAPFPSHTNPHSVAPLYLVLYPPNTAGVFNCMGVPGNCPDHSGGVAAAATAIMPSVYGTDPSKIPGHDHLVSVPAGHGDFNVAWHVYLELFTSAGAVRHITTEADLDAAIASGDVIQVDSGIEFLCAVVSQASYLLGTPVGG
jgi:hypothetical protein